MFCALTPDGGGPDEDGDEPVQAQGDPWGAGEVGHQRLGLANRDRIEDNPRFFKIGNKNFQNPFEMRLESKLST